MLYMVTGRVRSGTSMMMRASEAGGMELSQVRSTGDRAKGGYILNPNGFYETSTHLSSVDFPNGYHNKLLKRFGNEFYHTDFLRNKILAVFMKRDPDEVEASMRRAFPIDHIPSLIKYDLEAELAMHRAVPNSRIIVVDYNQVLADPLGSFELLASQGWPITDNQAAADTVDQTLYRHRKATGRVNYHARIPL